MIHDAINNPQKKQTLRYMATEGWIPMLSVDEHIDRACTDILTACAILILSGILLNGSYRILTTSLNN